MTSIIAAGRISHQVESSRLPSGLLSRLHLIEITQALLILAVALVMLSGSFHTVAASKSQGENRLAMDQAGRHAHPDQRRAARSSADPAYTEPHIAHRQCSDENALPMDTFIVSTLDPGHRRSLEGFGPKDTVG